MNWNVVPAQTFKEHVARWEKLHKSSAGSPLLAADFVLSLLAAFGTGQEILAWHECDGKTDTMAILAPSRFGIWNTFQPSQAPIGIWLQRGTDAPVDLIRALLHTLPRIGLVLGITQCDPMLMCRPANRGTIRTLDYIQTARITITDAGSFDSYWQKRSKNLRSNLKKQRSRLRQDAIETCLEIWREQHQMTQAVIDYGNLEGSGWKAAGGTAVSADNVQGHFYRSMLEIFAARGAASVYRYLIGGELAAMDLCIEGEDCIVVLKTAYNEKLPHHLSPALLMREEVCRHLFETGRFKSIEFYGRVMEWHLRWTTEIRTMYHMNGYRWPTLAHLHMLLCARSNTGLTSE